MLLKIKLSLFSLLLCIITLIAACDGGDDQHRDNGATPGRQTREVTGVVGEGTAKHFSPGGNKTAILAMNVYDLISPYSAYATGQAGTFIVSALGRNGSIRESDTDPVTGGFTLNLPVDDCYTMSFTAHTGPGMMDEFWDFIVFQCGPEHIGEFDDQFCLTTGNNPVDLGVITLHSDHSFAMPMHNPLEEVDTNGDGTMDFHDPDYICGNVGDADHDGYYDDDSDNDGFHDDDMDHDGFHDDDMNHDGFHDGMEPDHGMGPGGGMMHR
ncbi:MAG TPA: hypothetical protein VGA95_06575 [Thermodesulfobacteriota bacterium]